MSRTADTMNPPRLPDFFIAGTARAGTTALHVALSAHPQVHMSTVKEPGFFLCAGKRPDRPRGPGDRHQSRQWVWQQQRYKRLFDGPPNRLRGESTPFYLYDRSALVRIAAIRPSARLLAIIRDPVDRAYSNWLYMRSIGLEPVGDFEEACSLEDDRIAAGWGPSWHYQRIGRYGQQIQHARSLFHPDQLLVLRYHQLVARPEETLDRICRFLGVDPGWIAAIAPEKVGHFIVDSWSNRRLTASIRLGSRIGSALPPAVWQAANRSLIRALRSRSSAIPVLEADVRRRLLEQFKDDLALLGTLTGDDFADWLADQGRGSFASRVAEQDLATSSAPS